MDKHTHELFTLINDAINEFMKNNPDFPYAETALNAVAIFSSSLINGIAKGRSLKAKLKLLDDVMQLEKQWIKFDHERTN